MLVSDNVKKISFYFIEWELKKSVSFPFIYFIIHIIIETPNLKKYED